MPPTLYISKTESAVTTVSSLPILGSKPWHATKMEDCEGENAEALHIPADIVLLQHLFIVIIYSSGLSCQTVPFL